MSDSRHASIRVRSYAITHPPGRVALTTRPGWDRLVFAAAGAFTALTAVEAWTIPAHRVLLVPDGIDVLLDTPVRVAIRCLYVVPDVGLVGDAVRVVGVSTLARELLLRAIDRSPMDLADPADEATITLLGRVLANETAAPLQLPMPTDPAARGLADAVRLDPATSLEHHLAEVAASRRTLERRFSQETGMSLGQWRRRSRVLAGVALLADGASVTLASVSVGYSSPSAFVEAFRRELGMAPRAFLRRGDVRHQ